MTELRRFHRAPASQKIELVHKGHCHQGCLDNISLNGALIHLDDDLGINTGELCMLRVHLQAAEPLPPLEIWSEAVHGSPDLVGIKFVGCEDDTSRRLSQLLEQLAGAPEKLESDLERIQGYLAEYRNTH